MNRQVLSTTIFKESAKLIVLAFIAMAIILYFRGHHAPGGGFVGGLVGGSIYGITCFAFGRTSADRVMIRSSRIWISAGLLLSTFCFLLPLFFDEIAFKGLWALGVGTPMLFDLGVFFLVIGFTMKCFEALWSVE